MKIGFIGAGNMAGAIAKVMVNTYKFRGQYIFITSNTVTSAQELERTCCAYAVKTTA